MLSLQEVKDEEQKEEVNGKMEQSNGKKVPVLTISLRPGKEHLLFSNCEKNMNLNFSKNVVSRLAEMENVHINTEQS